MRANFGTDLNQRAQRLVDVLTTGKEYVEELMRENERLHRNVAVLEGSVSSHQSEAARFQEQLQAQNLDRERAVTRLGRVEEENRDFAGRCVEMEQLHSNLANLYVASHQLHSTLDFKEVLQIVQEIVINFIGSECFAVLLLDEETGELRTIAAEGDALVPGIAGMTVRMGEGKLGQVTSTGESYFAREAFGQNAGTDHPLAAVPLKIKEKTIGLLVVYQLLQQKRAFSTTDYELFSLLAGQAATAIFSAKLYSDAERKLNTIQGFLESLTSA
jgi:transcriptional regulator with GAF, ATPase, and Fis domain